MGILEKLKDLTEPDTVVEAVQDVNILNFVELELHGNLRRKVISGGSNAIQYEVVPGPRTNTAKVITRSDNDSPKTNEYKFETGDSVIVVGDIVHLLKKLRPKRS